MVRYFLQNPFIRGMIFMGGIILFLWGTKQFVHIGGLDGWLYWMEAVQGVTDVKYIVRVTWQPLIEPFLAVVLGFVVAYLAAVNRLVTRRIEI